MFRVLSLIASAAVKSQGKGKRKSMISGQFSSFSNFLNFLKFRNSFWYQLAFVKLPILSELRYFFVKILTHYKTDLKYAVKMSLFQRYCLTRIMAA